MEVTESGFQERKPFERKSPELSRAFAIWPYSSSLEHKHKARDGTITWPLQEWDSHAKCGGVKNWELDGA